MKPPAEFVIMRTRDGVVHNYPSGDPTPSQADIEMTERIDLARQAIGVTIHDHVIIGKESDASFRMLGLI